MIKPSFTESSTIEIYGVFRVIPSDYKLIRRLFQPVGHLPLILSSARYSNLFAFVSEFELVSH